ncbi:MAG: hypothetical protein ABR875_00290 [Minisyncoccia bacterium]
MDSLKSKLDSLKQKLTANEEADKKLRADINGVLEAIFRNQRLGPGQIREFHLKNGVLFLEAKNKVVANELFLKKEELKALLQKNKDIKDVVIR